MAAKDTGTGKLYVLLASHHYRRGGAYPVTVALPGVASGRVVTATVIDQAHSNQLNAGLANAELQTVPVAAVAAAQVRIVMQARSVVMLEIAP